MAERKKMGRPANGATQILGISITPELKERIMAQARISRRSASSFACSLLEQALDNENSGAVNTVTPAPQYDVPKVNRPQARGRVSEGATAMLTISLQPELKAAVKAVAKMESRTASNMACLMLRDWIETWEANHPDVNIWSCEAES